MNVLHLLRKKSQLRASFIQNQISSHQKYKPYSVYMLDALKQYDGGFAELMQDQNNTLNLSEYSNRFDHYYFKFLKKITNRQLNKICNYISENKIEILHFHYGSDAGIYVPLLKKRLRPSVVSFYGYDCSGFPKRFLGFGKLWLKYRVFRYVDRVLAMSPDMKADLLKAGCPEEKIIVHYYGTDVTKFNFPTEDKFNHEKIILLILCSLVPQKGHLFLLQSIEKLVKSNIHLHFELRIVGTGELEEELKTFVKDHNLEKYVVFLGAIPYGKEEMFREFRNADIFVHPSVIASNGDKEGIPGALVEAMASGLPVISTYHAGIPHIIVNNKTGILVKEWDIDGLSNSIRLLMQDHEMRVKIGQAGKYHALQNLNLKDKETELECIYDTLVRPFI